MSDEQHEHDKLGNEQYDERHGIKGPAVASDAARAAGSESGSPSATSSEKGLRETKTHGEESNQLHHRGPVTAKVPTNETMTVGDRVFSILDKAFTWLGQTGRAASRVSAGNASDADRARWDIVKGPLAGVAKAAATLVCVGVLMWAGSTGYRLGGQSVVVADTPQYQQASQKLKWANVDLMESKQDVANREKQIKEANDAIDQAKKDREKYGKIVEEVQQAQRESKSPVLTVIAIGDTSQSYIFFETPMTVHNNTDKTYSFFEVYVQATDADGNVVHSGYALGESETTCEPNADCQIKLFDEFDPRGLKVTPTYWSVTATDGSSDYGRYGADVMSKQL
ncbi:hypothetical protein BMYO_1949 [Bifidobacterium myosotis]|uniref:Uncharacterized protein n=1 Tax=Bifidobacterium myosotis TaxID=1630166 RepID=A0A261FEA6_9BIFI|nr:hypothetical protein [Bifidobacterium myosotis]OZG57452.1 hypothetical protein BMYO_1949 [Bifidobacterium myosotis]